MKLKYKLTLLVLIPIIILGVCISTVSCYFAEEALADSNETQLKVAAEGFDKDEDVNAYQDNGIDITVFEGDTRVKSSIAGAVGSRASAEVVEKVLNGGEKFFSADVKVNGESYFGYYLPVEGGMIFAGKPKAEVDAVIRQLMFFIMAVSAVMMVVITVISFIMVNKIAKSIINASETVNFVAGGNLTCEVAEMSGKDEVCEMNNHVKNMVDNLKTMITKTSTVSQGIQRSVDDLHSTANSTLSASREIAKAIEDVAYNNTKQAGIASDIASSLDVMQQMSAEITSSVNDIESCSADLTENCSIMRAKIEATHNSSELMSDSVISIKEKIDATNKVIAKMSEILESIEEISAQTKLLSLNASIEAARAGEAGRGFSVVADSISKLSGDTAEELERIREIISNITQDFRACEDCIDDVVGNNTENMRDIAQVIESFQSVNLAIENTSEQVNVISRAVTETSGQIVEMAKEVEVLGSMSESNAAASEEVNASVQELTALMHSVDSSSEELSEEAGSLMEALSVFKY